MDKKRVFLVEDHQLIRQIVKDVLDSQSAIEVVGMAGTAEEALEHLNVIEADLALIDMSLPRMSGAELTSEIQRRWPGLACLMLSGHREAKYVRLAMSAGARGYVLKGDPYQLTDAVHRVLAGETYLSDNVRDLVE